MYHLQPKPQITVWHRSQHHAHDPAVEHVRGGRAAASLSQTGQDILPYMTILRSMCDIEKYGNGGRWNLLGTAYRRRRLPTFLQNSLHFQVVVEVTPKIKSGLHGRNCPDISNAFFLDLAWIGEVEGLIVASHVLSPEFWDFDNLDPKKDTSFVINESRSVYHECMEAHLRSKNILLRTPIELWSMEASQKNLGSSFLPHFTVEQELRKEAPIEYFFRGTPQQYIIKMRNYTLLRIKRKIP